MALQKQHLVDCGLKAETMVKNLLEETTFEESILQFLFLFKLRTMKENR